MLVSQQCRLQVRSRIADLETLRDSIANQLVQLGETKHDTHEMKIWIGDKTKACEELISNYDEAIEDLLDLLEVEESEEEAYIALLETRRITLKKQLKANELIHGVKSIEVNDIHTFITNIEIFVADYNETGVFNAQKYDSVELKGEQ